MRRRVIRAAIIVVALSTIASVAAIAADGPGLARSVGDAPDSTSSRKRRRRSSRPSSTATCARSRRGSLRRARTAPSRRCRTSRPARPRATLRSRPPPRPPRRLPRRRPSRGSTTCRTARASPPDTNGDVGPNHYVETVNTSIGIYSKTGAQLYANTFDALFSAAGTGTPCDNANQGDPVVLYDPIGDRWIISDFAWADANFSTGPVLPVLRRVEDGRPHRRRMELLRVPAPGRRGPSRLPEARGVARRDLHVDEQLRHVWVAVVPERAGVGVRPRRDGGRAACRRRDRQFPAPSAA